MPYTVRSSLRAKTVKTVSLLLIRLLSRRLAKSHLPSQGKAYAKRTVEEIYSRVKQFKQFDKSKFETIS